MVKAHRAGALAELARFIAGYPRGPWSRMVPPPSYLKASRGAMRP